MEVLLAIAVAAVAALAALIVWREHARSKSLAVRDEDVDRIVQLLMAQSAEMQGKATDQVLKLAQDKLKGEAERVRDELARVSKTVQEIDKARGESITTLSANVEHTFKATKALEQTTTQLQRALSGSQARGQWGERMAEDVLRVAGFIEGVQYRRQQQIEGSGTVPDFTFLLPQERVLNMDVKFSFDNFLRYLEAQTEQERAVASKQFVADVRNRVKEVVSRGYINPEQGTLDYMLVFIPNEQVYSFIHEQDPGLIDFALGHKVILCSPFSLFAILAVMRQSVENFRLSQQTNEILKALSDFDKQWHKYKDGMEDVGKYLDKAKKSYDAFAITRTNKLDVQVRKVEKLRTRAGLEDDQDDELAEIEGNGTQLNRIHQL